MKVKNAVVLAAGMGRRLLPLTLDIPKPLIRIGEKTLLDHSLDSLVEAGVERIIVNCHYKAEQIMEHLSKRTVPEIVISRESTLLDTGGAIKNVLQWLGDDPFYIVNSDVLWQDSTLSLLERLKGFWSQTTMDREVILVLVDRHMAVGYDGGGNYYRHKSTGRLVRDPSVNGLIFTGISLVHPYVYHQVKEDVFSNTLVWHHAECKGRLFGLIHKELWYHIGNLESLGEVKKCYECFFIKNSH